MVFKDLPPTSENYARYVVFLEKALEQALRYMQPRIEPSEEYAPELAQWVKDKSAATALAESLEEE